MVISDAVVTAVRLEPLASSLHDTVYPVINPFLPLSSGAVHDNVALVENTCTAENDPGGVVGAANVFRAL